MDLTTLITQFSGAIQNKLPNTNFTSLLSTFNELSAIPSHPYEKIKHNLFGKNYKFLTINDLDIPQDFCPLTYTRKLTAINQKISQLSLHALSALKNIDPKFQETAITVDPETIKKNIEFTEIVKTITVSDIKTRPIELAQMLTSYYIKNCS